MDPVCHLAVGLLQEALYWVSGGKVFNVEEKTCIAAGDATCTIEIDANPHFLKEFHPNKFVDVACLNTGTLRPCFMTFVE